MMKEKPLLLKNSLLQKSQNDKSHFFFILNCFIISIIMALGMIINEKEKLFNP